MSSFNISIDTPSSFGDYSSNKNVENPIFYPCGLTNLGNTCFLNSCVQLLNYTDEFAFEIEKINNDTSLPQTHDQVVFYEWRELREMMNKIKGQMTNPVATPGKFVKMIHDIARLKGRDLFTGWAQNDLPEFLLFMIECMHNSRRRAVSINIYGSSESSTDDLAFQCYSMLKDNYERGEYSEFSDICYGVYVSRLFTTDGSILHSNKAETYSLLDLPIPNSGISQLLKPDAMNVNLHIPHIKLTDCFDAFMADEILTGWFNEKTNNIESVKKNITFWSFPNILIIILKRYSPDGMYKNESFIDFPLDDLDLSKYVVGYNANSYKYKLFGVANHMGGISGGHYTAFVNTDNKWYCFNDSNVNEIPVNVVVSPFAYCLFYRKK